MKILILGIILTAILTFLTLYMKMKDLTFLTLSSGIVLSIIFEAILGGTK